MPQRTFLSWSRPLLPAAVEHLCAGWRGGMLDLSSLVVVVPTAEAGRRLRTALAHEAAKRDTAVLSPHVITPEAITAWATAAMPASATAADELLTWMQVLLALPLEEYPALFPVPPVNRDAAWARGTAAELLRLRHHLEEGGHNIAEAARRLGSSHVEAERWNDLSRLETRAVSALRSHGLTDPLAARICAAAQPVLPEGAVRVVILAVPDPISLVISAFENLERQAVPVEVIIHGDSSQEALWDLWGRPVAELWAERVITIPDAGNRIQITARPAEEAELLIAALRTGEAIGSADPATAPPLLDAAAREGLEVFDPNGLPLATHEISWLMQSLTGLLRTDSAADTARFLRIPDVLRAVREGGASAAFVLHAWDEFHQTHLPLTLSDAVQLSQHWNPRRAGEEARTALIEALHWIQSQKQTLLGVNSPGAIHKFLTTVYSGKSFASESIRSLFDDALEQWQEALDATAQAAASAGFKAKAATVLETAAYLLRDARLYPDNSNGAPVLHGWLELAWLDAPDLTVAGMNEGFAPDSVSGDPWLPDSVRGLLDLKTNAVRLARDSFLLTSLIECRHQARLTLLAARESADGDPLKPSRLLLRCPDDELAARALHLFPDTDDEVPRPSPPAWHRAWTLLVPPPEPEAPVFSVMSVTQFSDYLACPFRFYLKHVLRMEPFDAARDEMDPRDFGSLIHDALQALHEDETLRHSDNEPAIAAFLDDKIQFLTRRRYGAETALPLVIQLESARNRLRALAGIHAAQREDGWRVEHTEVSFPELPDNHEPVMLDEVLIRGRIDLIERLRDSPQRRVLDYKTSSKGAKPAEAHLKPVRGRDTFPDWQLCDYEGKPHRWINLQLPFYAWIVSRLPGHSDGAQAGYVNLPPALTETAVNMWHELDDTLIRSAIDCARGVIRSIRAGIFWPPARTVDFDDFAPLVFDDIEESFDPSLLEKFRQLRAGKALS